MSALQERSGTGTRGALGALLAPATADAIRAAASAGVEIAILCAGGFSEAGEDGARLQDELAQVSSETGVRLIGPNTSGVIVPVVGLTASFVPGLDVVREGRVAVVAASGGVKHALVFAMANRNIGIRVAIGLGNAVDVDKVDVLEALVDDEATGLVALHIESVRDGRRLVDAVRRLVERVPVVTSVVGRSDIAEFAQSHAGALAAPWRTTRAALRQAGAVVVDDERALVDAVATLSVARPARRTSAASVGIVTGQGRTGPAPCRCRSQQRDRRTTAHGADDRRARGPASAPDVPAEPGRHRPPGVQPFVTSSAP